MRTMLSSFSSGSVSRAEQEASSRKRQYDCRDSFFPYSETEVLYCGVVLKRKHTIGSRPQVG